jgi:hypothetical protein
MGNRDAGRLAKSVRNAGSRPMGYFILTTVCTVQYLGYIALPKPLLIAACVVFVLYDAIKR